jgi:hypothetical protein
MVSKRTVFWSVVAFLLVAGIGFTGHEYWQVAHPIQLSRHERQATERLLEARMTASPPPPRASEKTWGELTGIVRNGYGNVFFSPYGENLDEMRRFRLDLEKYLDTVESVDVENLRWIMRRLAESGGRSRARVDQLTPLFEEIAIELIFEQLKSPPPDVAQGAWKRLAGMVRAAYVKVASSSSFTLNEEMRFHEDLADYLAATDGLNVPTLRWIWRRLGEFGPEARDYIKELTPKFEDLAQSVEESLE